MPNSTVKTYQFCPNCKSSNLIHWVSSIDSENNWLVCENCKKRITRLRDPELDTLQLMRSDLIERMQKFKHTDYEKEFLTKMKEKRFLTVKQESFLEKIHFKIFRLPLPSQILQPRKNNPVSLCDRGGEDVDYWNEV